MLPAHRMRPLNPALLRTQHRLNPSSVGVVVLTTTFEHALQRQRLIVKPFSTRIATLAAILVVKVAVLVVVVAVAVAAAVAVVTVLSAAAQLQPPLQVPLRQPPRPAPAQL